MRKIRPSYPTIESKQFKGRDNKMYYNTRGGVCSCGIFERVPSLKRSKKTWENFYKLFPYIKSFLMTDGESGHCLGQTAIRMSLQDNIYTVVDERVHGSTTFENNGILRRRTTKFLKVW